MCSKFQLFMVSAVLFQKAQWTERVIFPLQKWFCASSLSILITVTTIPSVKPLKLAIEITFSHLNPNIVVILNVDDYWTCSFFFIKSPLLLHSRSPPSINILCYAVLIAQSCLTLCNSLNCSPPCSCPFSSQEHWSGLPCPLLQGIFLTQGSNPGLQQCRWSSLWFEPPGSPRKFRRGSYSLSFNLFFHPTDSLILVRFTFYIVTPLSCSDPAQPI